MSYSFQGFPSTGIKVFSVLLHSHLKGRKLILRHIRDGKELEPIAHDNHYDFNYQEYRNRKEEVTVLPGDELIMECEYNTKENNTFVLGGFSTTQEMCEAFIFYYPKSNLIDCRSQIEYYSYLEALGVQNATGSVLRQLNLPYDPTLLPLKQQEMSLADDIVVLEFGAKEGTEKNAFSALTIQRPNALAGESLFKYMQSLNWKNNSFAREVETKWRHAPRYMHCAGEVGNRIKTPNHIVRSRDYEGLVQKKRECSRFGSNSSKPMRDTLGFVMTLFLGGAASVTGFARF